MSGVSSLTNFNVFFKVRDAVKKAEVKTEEIKTIDDLLHLFFEKFETLKYSSTHDQRFILTKYSCFCKTQIGYEKRRSSLFTSEANNVRVVK